MKFTNVWKQSFRWILGALVVILAAYVTIILLDVFVGWQVYGYLFEKLAGYGVSDYLSGTLWFGPAIVISVLKETQRLDLEDSLGRVGVVRNSLYTVLSVLRRNL